LCKAVLIRRLRAWWPGPVQAAGFTLGLYELGRWVLLGRPLDSSALALAAALIAWRAPRRVQGRRNGRRVQGDEES
jgi:hypothetical protein